MMESVLIPCTIRIEYPTLLREREGGRGGGREGGREGEGGRKGGRVACGFSTRSSHKRRKF